MPVGAAIVRDVRVPESGTPNLLEARNWESLMLHPRAHAAAIVCSSPRAVLGYVEAIKGFNHRGISLESESMRAATNSRSSRRRAQ